MKIPNKQELQQTAFNLLPDSDFKKSMSMYKKKTYSFLLIDVTLT